MVASMTRNGRTTPVMVRVLLVAWLLVSTLMLVRGILVGSDLLISTYSLMTLGGLLASGVAIYTYRKQRK